MKIERIDDKTVKCFLSNEELEEYEITYKDFILRSDKARELMEEIVQQAEEEVGYQLPKFAFDLQIMMIPDQGMILTFSEKDSEDFQPGSEFLECLKEMKNILQRKHNSKMKEAQDNQEIQDGQEAQAQKPQTKQPEKPQAVVTFAVFCFSSLRNVCEYAKVLPMNLRIQSALYQMDGQYYLYLDKGSASYERYSRACIQAMEFGALYTAEHAKAVYLREHADCLIADHAVKRLRFA